MLGAVIAGFLFESVVEDHSKDLAVAASVYDDALTAEASYTTLLDSTRGCSLVALSYRARRCPAVTDCRRPLSAVGAARAMTASRGAGS